MQKGFYTNISLSFSRSIELCFLWFRALFSLSTNIAFPDVILSLPPAEAKITKKPSGCQYFFYLLQIARDGRNDEEEDKRTNSQTHHRRREKQQNKKRLRIGYRCRGYWNKNPREREENTPDDWEQLLPTAGTGDLAARDCCLRLSPPPTEFKSWRNTQWRVLARSIEIYTRRQAEMKHFVPRFLSLSAPPPPPPPSYNNAIMYILITSDVAGDDHLPVVVAGGTSWITRTVTRDSPSTTCPYLIWIEKTYNKQNKTKKKKFSLGDSNTQYRYI